MLIPLSYTIIKDRAGACKIKYAFFAHTFLFHQDTNIKTPVHVRKIAFNSVKYNFLLMFTIITCKMSVNAVNFFFLYYLGIRIHGINDKNS